MYRKNSRLKQDIFGLYHARLGPSFPFSFTMSFEPHHGYKLLLVASGAGRAPRAYASYTEASQRALRCVRLSHLPCSNCTRSFSICSAECCCPCVERCSPPSVSASRRCSVRDLLLHMRSALPHFSCHFFQRYSPSPHARSPVQGTAIPCACPFQTKTSSSMPQPLRL